MPEPKPLASQAKRLLDAIKSFNGEWVSRRDIAERMGKKHLVPTELAYLELLEARGYIEDRKVDRPGVIHYSMQYRTKEGLSE